MAIVLANVDKIVDSNQNEFVIANGSGGMMGVDVITSGSDTDYVFSSGTTASGLNAIDTSSLNDGATFFWDQTAGTWKMSNFIIEEYS